MDWADNISVIGGRNSINSTELPCKIGASGALCIRITNLESDTILIDGRNSFSSNPLLMNVLEFDLIDNIKIHRKAYVSYVAPQNMNVYNITFLELEIDGGSRFDDSRMFLNNTNKTALITVENFLIISNNS